MAKAYGKIYQNNSNVSITPTDVYNLYPVGSIYLSTIKVNPSQYFGGEWVQLSGGYIYCAGGIIEKTSYTGWGTQSTTLSEGQIPSHRHSVSISTSGGGHNHNQYFLEFRWPKDGYYYGTKSVGRPVSQGTQSTDEQATTSDGSHSHTVSGDTGYYGGASGHTHNIATIDVFMYKRVS